MSDYKTQVQELYQQLSQKKKKIETLKTLLTRLEEEKPLFNETDFKIVQDKIQKYEQECEKIFQVYQDKKTEYDRRERIYKEKILTLRQDIEKRNQVLENLDKRFKMSQIFPDMVEKFAQVQADYLQKVEEQEQELSKPF